jgi:K+-transporting ATPase ATPase C chain
MRKDIISSVIGIVVLTLVFGIAYPLVVTGVSQVAFPGNANGQKVYVDGKLVGSRSSARASPIRSSRTASPSWTRAGTR